MEDKIKDAYEVSKNIYDDVLTQGKSGITDSLVKNVLSKKGWFTPPFQTEEQLTDTLNGLYTDFDLHVDGSMVYFYCTK